MIFNTSSDLARTIYDQNGARVIFADDVEDSDRFRIGNTSNNLRNIEIKAITLRLKLIDENLAVKMRLLNLNCVSHRFSTVQLADRIVVLENSRIVEVGSHSDLMLHNGLYAEMFLKQASSYNL